MSDLEVLFNDEDTFQEDALGDSLYIEEDIENLKNLKETSQKFLKVNDFEIKEPEFKNFTEDEFLEYLEKNSNTDIVNLFSKLNIQVNIRNSMSQVYKHKKDNTKIFIYFLSSNIKTRSVGIDVIKDFLKLILLLDCNEGVIISDLKMTSRSNERIDTSNIKGFTGEGIYHTISYNDDDFIDLTNHSLTPEVLKIYRNEEADNFCEENSLDPKTIPRINITDPLCKFYRARVGDIMKTKILTGTQDTLLDEKINYRRVVYGIQKSKK